MKYLEAADMEKVQAKFQNNVRRILTKKIQTNFEIPSPSHVTLGGGLSLTKPQFLHLKRGS